MNNFNKNFYAKFPIGNLNFSFAKSSGLENAFELDTPYISELIEESNSILEIGAGEGRIIEGLLDREFSGKIFGVERSQVFIKHLSDKFSKNSNVEIIEGDILDNRLPNVDLGLFLWSGILEFSKEEQQNVIGKLTSYCKKLVIDVPAINSDNNASHGEGQYLSLRTHYGELNVRIPLETEIREWCNGLEKKIQRINYTTLNQRERTFYIVG